MYLKIRGLVLRVSAYNDSDALVTLLTSDYGKLTVKARGLRRRNSKIASACQLLAYSEFVLFEHREFYTVNEANPIELFAQLRNDLSKFSLATYFAQVSELVSQEDFSDPHILALTLNCMYALCRLEYSCEKVKAVFELRIACAAGYMPDLQGCRHCGNDFPDRFDIAQGRFECSGCRSPESGAIRLPVTRGVLDSVRYICCCDPKRIFMFNAGKETLDSLNQVSEGYLSVQLERDFSALNFYKTLIASE